MKDAPAVGAAPPGGRGLALAKQAAERALWTRVGIQRRWSGVRRYERPAPPPVPPTDVLHSSDEWRQSVKDCRRLGLPLHRDRPKNWDALGAVSTVLAECGRQARVLDAGSARYSSILPWLRLYGLTDLVGNNLEFGEDVRRQGVVFRYGDIADMDFPDNRFDAVTCMSVIEHGVPQKAFFAEVARVLRPGGVLVVSTDYDAEPPDTSGIMMYGQPVTIFSPAGIADMVALASAQGLDLMGEFRPEHAERPVHWTRIDLHYTFARLAFRRR